MIEAMGVKRIRVDQPCVCESGEKGSMSTGARRLRG
jgi:hypothetical protein